MTCQSFSSVSLDPPLVLFVPAKTSRAWPLIQRAGRFCVNFLADDQAELSNTMASRGVDKFEAVTWQPSEATGSPLLDGTLGLRRLQHPRRPRGRRPLRRDRPGPRPGRPATPRARCSSTRASTARPSTERLWQAHRVRSLEPAEDLAITLVRRFLLLCESPRTRRTMLRMVRGSTGNARAGRRFYRVVNRAVLSPVDADPGRAGLGDEDRADRLAADRHRCAPIRREGGADGLGHRRRGDRAGRPVDPATLRA